uniref:Uncharacterized protein n=1 Tax=Timema cristinae TaxID=61476 RepID=A0A7R9GU77_TIMCR|nr:unnamed protein product [Timema cristinae]
MAQCNFLNEIKNCVRMDDPLTKGPLPRWQKKRLEASNNSINLSNVNNSMNKLSASFNTSNSRTPSKQGGVATKKTPSKTPSKTPKKSPVSPTQCEKGSNHLDSVDFTDLQRVAHPAGWWVYCESGHDVRSGIREGSFVISG